MWKEKTLQRKQKTLIWMISSLCLRLKKKNKHVQYSLTKFINHVIVDSISYLLFYVFFYGFISWIMNNLLEYLWWHNDTLSPLYLFVYETCGLFPKLRCCGCPWWWMNWVGIKVQCNKNKWKIKIIVVWSAWNTTKSFKFYIRSPNYISV